MIKKSVINKKKYIFNLKNINVENIEKKYGVNTSFENNSQLPLYITKLTDLSSEKINNDSFSFFDESKKIHKCNISMIDFQSKRSVQLLRYNCFWDRHAFDTIPLGIPIRYVSCQAVKKYYSHISKDVYTIKENITKSLSANNKVNIHTNDINNININSNSFCETYGVVCSWNCMAAFINENKHQHMFKHSKSLMLKIYNETMGTNINTIELAPHWTQLIEYGGNLSIIDFRNGFNNIEYNNHGYIKNFPEFKSIKLLYEETIKI
jgi:hypothetical protein